MCNGYIVADAKDNKGGGGQRRKESRMSKKHPKPLVRGHQTKAKAVKS